MPVRQGTKSKIVYFSPQEWEIVCKRAEKCNKRTGTYIREIAVQGTIKNYRLDRFNDLAMSFNRIGNEINQIAKGTNSTQSIYKKDIEDLKTSFGFLDNMIRNYLKPLKNEINL